MKILIFLACLMGGCLQASDYDKEIASEQGIIEKAYWMSEEGVLKNHETTFRNFCKMCSMDFDRYKEIILSDGILPFKEQVEEYFYMKPSALRPYTEEERTAIFIYLNGYKAAIMQYAEEMQEVLENHELQYENFEHFRSLVTGFVVQIITGNWKAALFSTLASEVTDYFSWKAVSWSPYATFRRKADWMELYYARIEKAETCQLMNLRIIN